MTSTARHAAVFGWIEGPRRRGSQQTAPEQRVSLPRLNGSDVMQHALSPTNSSVLSGQLANGPLFGRVSIALQMAFAAGPTLLPIT